MHKFYYAKKVVELIIIFSSILHFVSSYVLKISILDQIAGYGFLISVLLFLILQGVVFRYVGSPNNEWQIIYSFDEKIYETKGEELVIKEIEKGIWQIENFYPIAMFNMRGWIPQSRYIYKVLVTALVLAYYNAKKQIALALPFGNQYATKEKLDIVFINLKGKSKKVALIRNYRILKPVFTRLRLALCLAGRYSDEKNTEHYDIPFSHIYRNDWFKKK